MTIADDGEILMTIDIKSCKGNYGQNDDHDDSGCDDGHYHDSDGDDDDKCDDGDYLDDDIVLPLHQLTGRRSPHQCPL